MHRIRPWLIGTLCATLLIVAVPMASAAPGASQKVSSTSPDSMVVPSWLADLLSAVFPGWSSHPNAEGSAQSGPASRTSAATGAPTTGTGSTAAGTIPTTENTQIDPDG